MTAPETVRSEADSARDAKTFADLGLNDAMLKALKEVGYETPSAIQAATIPLLLAGRDVVGLAQTGTGKTAAFALPILSRKLAVGYEAPTQAGTPIRRSYQCRRTAPAIFLKISASAR